MKYMTVENAIGIHGEEINVSGGLHGIRDIGLLESAILSAEQTFGGELLYKTPQEVASVYFHHIIKNHPFVDGNKRTGLAVYISFMRNNGYICNCDDDELYNMTVSVADNSLSFNDVVNMTKRIFY